MKEQYRIIEFYNSAHQYGEKPIYKIQKFRKCFFLKFWDDLDSYGRYTSIPMLYYSFEKAKEQLEWIRFWIEKPEKVVYEIEIDILEDKEIK